MNFIFFAKESPLDEKKTLPLPCSPLASAPRSLPTQCPGSSEQVNGRNRQPGSGSWQLDRSARKAGFTPWGVVGEMPLKPGRLGRVSVTCLLE